MITMASTSDPNKKTYSQATRLLKVHTPAFPDDTLLLNRFSGTECVSEPFEFRLSLLSEQADLELKILMGEPITVTLVTSSKEARYFHGYVTSFMFAESDGGMAFYEAVISPWTEFMKYRYNCRVFQEMSVIDIIRKVLSAPEYKPYAKFEIDLEEADYTPITLCVQYNESDFSFISRLMEEYGIYYHYLFEESCHTLVIKDDSANSPLMPMQDKIEYNTESGAAKNDTIRAWRPARKLVSNSYASKTFDFKKPNDAMNAEVETNHQMGDLPKMERYEYPGVYAYKDDQAGNRFVKLRIEEQEFKSKLFHGQGNVRSLTCAHTFELKNHFDLGGTVHDRTFFVVSVTHTGANNFMNEDQSTIYENQFTCIRKKIPFRPGRCTPKPTMRGLQSAIVVGSSSDEIHCDKYGRILLQFHWDREGQFNAQSLCWVRVATQWAGSKFGFVSLPRVGTEVLVDFLEGDPDRPIVTGAVYNEVNMPPWELPNNKTQSGILTRSTTGGNYDNSNALRFEDKKGAEEVWLHAEKDQRIEVEHDESHEVGHDRKKTIKHDENVMVGNNRTEHVVGNETITVDQNRTETVIGNESIAVTGYKNTTIAKFKSETVALASTEQVGLARNLTVGGAYTIEVGAAMNTTIGGVQGTQVGKSRFVSVGSNQTTTIGGSHTEDVTKNRTMTAGDRIELICGASSLIMKKDGTIVLKGKDISVQASGGATVKASGDLVLKGSKIKEN
jgi:type VI secretion system secreted protein VgrG